MQGTAEAAALFQSRDFFCHEGKDSTSLQAAGTRQHGVKSQNNMILILSAVTNLKSLTTSTFFQLFRCYHGLEKREITN